MYKVLLVDDELLVRNYLRTLIKWEKNGFFICGEARNGESAIEQIDSLKPHIVILDINMPGMDGVSLSAHISRHYPDISMIVLSSYDKYEYVRETLINGAVDYLLKHAMDDHALLRVLGKAKKQLAQLSERQETEESWKKLSQTVSRSYLKELALGSQERLGEIEAYFHNNVSMKTQNMIVLVMQVVHFPFITKDYSDAEKNGYVRSIHDLCRQTLGDSDRGIAAHIDQGKFVFLTAFPDLRSESAMMGQLESLKQRLEKSLYVYLNILVVFGTSRVCQKLSEIQQQYNQAVIRMESELSGQYYRGSSVSDKSKLAQEEVMTLSIEQEKAILSALEVSDRTSIKRLISEIFERLRNRQIKSRSLQAVVGELVQLADKVRWKSGLDRMQQEVAGPLAPPTREQLGENADIKRIQEWVEALYMSLLDQLARQQFKGYSQYVKQAMQHIREHYKDNLSLDWMAESVGITSSYLGKLFKEETGTSFSEYVNRLRIEMSKQYIERGHKIKDVYQEVGFSSYNYFFKVFKDVEGITPQTFLRNKHMSE
jgi:two-component system response regulator YesN